MLFLLVSVTLLSLLLCGTGCLFNKLLGYTAVRNPWLYFWLGFFIVSVLAMLTSLFVPLNMISLAVFFIAGAAGLPFFCREYIQNTARHNGAEKTIFACTAGLVLFFVIRFAAYKSWPGAYDTDLYHAQIIRWYNEYGTAPGIGNLHTRLAFNSSWHSLAALFDNGIWDNRSAWIMPALSLFGGVLYCLHDLIFTNTGEGGVRFYALCILAWLGIKISDSYPALYYDDPVHILNAIIVLEAYFLLLDSTGNLSRQKTDHASNLLMLAAGAFMIKPIGAVSLLFSGLLSLYLLVRNSKQSVVFWVKIYLPALCAFGVWVTKNMFLSGYLVYPLPLLALPFDWTMKYEAVKGNYDAVVGWARMPGSGYHQSLENGFWFWFKPWLIDKLYSGSFRKLAVFPSMISALTWFFVFRWGNIKRALYFFVWSLFSILYWFLAAPDIRFGSGFFWVCLASAMLFAVPEKPFFEFSALWKNRKIRLAFFYFWTLGILGGTGFTLVSSKRDVLSIGTVPSRPVREYTVPANPPFTVWIPMDEADDRTGNSPLPSAPGKPVNLEMREPGNLAKGFRPARQGGAD
jgi:hypothetical protein